MPRLKFHGKPQHARQLPGKKEFPSQTKAGCQRNITTLFDSTTKKERPPGAGWPLMILDSNVWIKNGVQISGCSDPLPDDSQHHSQNMS
jgi:hypothetical protein